MIRELEVNTASIMHLYEIAESGELRFETRTVRLEQVDFDVSDQQLRQRWAHERAIFSASTEHVQLQYCVRFNALALVSWRGGDGSCG